MWKWAKWKNQDKQTKKNKAKWTKIKIKKKSISTLACRTTVPSTKSFYKITNLMVVSNHSDYWVLSILSPCSNQGSSKSYYHDFKTDLLVQEFDFT